MADLTFGTFNLRNLQDADAPRYQNSTPYTPRFFARKAQWIGDKLKELGADVVGFQELWSRGALTHALDRVNLDDDYVLAAPASGDTGRIHNALAVKSPHRLIGFSYVVDLPDQLVLRKNPTSGDVDEGIGIAVDTEKFSRPVLVANVQPVVDGDDAGPPIAVVVAHLKSKRPMELGAEVLGTPGLITPDRAAIGSALSMIKRTAEAAGIRLLVSRLQRDDPNDDGPGRPVIVMGDLNAAQHSTPLSIITTQPSYRLAGGSRVGRSSKWGMYSVATLQELRSLRDVYFTYIHEGFRDSLDHIVLTQHFYDYSQHRIWAFQQSTILNDHLPHAKDGPDHEVVFSDHGIVRAEFNHNPAD